MAQTPTLQQANFGVGYLFGINAALANPTPVQFATLQDIQPDASFEIKELYGQYTFPELIARGKGKLSLKAKTGRIYSQILNQLVLPGATSTAGITSMSANEAGSIPGSPYQITVANSATWTQDLGVVFTSGAKAGLQLTRVASAPATGQYSVAAGVYTFASADTGTGVAISYAYTVAATGITNSYTNQLLGAGSTVQLVVGNFYNGNFFGFKFYAAMCDKLSFPMKNDDFTLNDLEFKCFADSTGRVWDQYTLS
jgi:hypothetical protein